MNPFIDNFMTSSGDAYAGLDHKVELTFHAHAEDEFVRKMPVHQVPAQGGTGSTIEGDHGCWEFTPLLRWIYWFLETRSRF